MASDDRAARCRAWNGDPAHQRMAGQARAQSFTHAHQVQAGQASYRAFMARFRAETGAPQHFPLAAAKYVAPEQIRSVGHSLPPPLQRLIHAAWGAGYGWGIDHWLLPVGVVPALPTGSLFAVEDDEAHTWAEVAPGWLGCTVCYGAALCPLCLPTWGEDAVLARLPQALCGAHGGEVVQHG